MTDTKELRRLLAVRDSANPNTLIWDFYNSILKDALDKAALGLLYRLEKAEELLKRVDEDVLAWHNRATGDDVEAFLAQKETPPMSQQPVAPANCANPKCGHPKEAHALDGECVATMPMQSSNYCTCTSYVAPPELNLSDNNVGCLICTYPWSDHIEGEGCPMPHPDLQNAEPSRAKVQVAKGEAKPHGCDRCGSTDPDFHYLTCGKIKPVATPIAPDPELEELAIEKAAVPETVAELPPLDVTEDEQKRAQAAWADNNAGFEAENLAELYCRERQLRSVLAELAQAKAALAEATKDVIGIACPFCGEDDYDLIGLKAHIWSCDEYNAVRTISQERADKMAAREGSKL